jgi:plasmid stability protein
VKVDSITIRNIDDRLKERLQARAAVHGQSMEDEARDILRDVLQQGVSISASANLYEAIRRVVEPLSGIEIGIPAREPIREAPRFE